MSCITFFSFHHFAHDSSSFSLSFPFAPEYEKLKKQKAEQVEQERQEHLDKLKRDLGEGEAVAMGTTASGFQASHFGSKPRGISLGLNLDSDDDDEVVNDEEEEDEEEKQEYESFKRFMEREMKNKEDSNTCQGGDSCG